MLQKLFYTHLFPITLNKICVTYLNITIALVLEISLL